MYPSKFLKTGKISKKKMTGRDRGRLGEETGVKLKKIRWRGTFNWRASCS